MSKAQTSGPKKVDPEWLFMMYMVAHDDHLDALAVQDLLEIEGAVAQNKDVAAVVQIQRRWPEKPQRYLIANGAPPKLIGEASSAGMGKVEVLESFLEESVAYVENAESTKFCLVLWGHSYGLGFGRDHGDELRLGELRQALDAFKQERAKLIDSKKKPGEKPKRDARLELLGANTCVMSYIEAMYELKDSAQYLVASQTFVPFAGWPYDRILPRVSGKDPESVGRIIVDEYVNFFNEPDREERVAMTLTNLDRVGSFADLLHELGVAIKDTTKAPQALPVMRDSFFANPAGTTRPVLDLLSLSGDLAEAAEDLRAAPESTKTLIAAAGRLKAIANEIRREFKGPNAESTDRLIVHSRAHPSLENFHGVGVFAPFVVDDGRLRRLIVHDGKRRRASSEPPRSDDGEEEFKRVREGWVKYNELAIFKRPTVNSAGKPAGDVVAASSHASKPCWPELVFGTLAREQPEETVDANGIVRRADRSAVNQMLFAVDASHRLLARATEAARTVAKQELIGRIDPKCAQRANKLLARLGPPDLRLTTLEAVLKRKPPTETQCIDTPEASPLIDALNKVERRLGQVERTVRRVVTDATLGIGPSRSPDGIGASLSQKSMDGGLKEKPIEQGLLEKSMDQGLFDVDKSLDPGFGSPTGALDQISLGSKIVFASSNSELGSLATVELLGKVTRGLLLLERDVASIERNIADFLANQERIVPALPGDRFAETLEDRLDELFDLLEQDRARAHMTIRWVLRHPTFGLGPGAPAIGRAEREAFATTAGFNPHQLRLLSGPKRRGMCGD